MPKTVNSIAIVIHLSRGWVSETALLIMVHQRREFCGILGRQFVQFFSDRVFMESDKLTPHTSLITYRLYTVKRNRLTLLELKKNMGHSLKFQPQCRWASRTITSRTTTGIMASAP